MRARRRPSLLIVVLCMVTALSRAQMATTRPATQPTTQVALRFDKVPVKSVLDKLCEDYGFVLVRNDAPDTTRVSVYSPLPVPAEKAIEILNSALKDNGGYVATLNDHRILRVLSRDHASENPPVFYGADPDDIPDSDDIRTQVMPVGALDAVKLKQDLTPLVSGPGATLVANAASNALVMTERATNVRRIASIITKLNVRKGAASDIRVIQLKYADADSAAKLITTLFSPSQTNQSTNNPGGGPGGGPIMFRPPVIMGPGGFGPGGGPGGFGGGNNANNASDQASQTKVAAAADTRTNTVVVTGPPDELKTIVDVLKQLDTPASETSFFLYRVKNGQAVDMAATLNGMFQQTGANSSSSNRNSSGLSYNNGVGSNRSSSNRSSGMGSTSGLGNSSGTAVGGFSPGGFGNTGGLGSPNGGGSNGANRAGANSSSSASFVGQVYVVADQDTNSLLVTTATKYRDDVEKIINQLDRPIPQVLIKVLVAEVTHDNSVDFGTDFSILNTRPNGNGQSFGQTFGSPGTGLVINFLENNLQAQLHLLAEQNKLDVLSRPYILASDNQEAYVMVGQEVPIVTSNTTTSLGQTISNYEYQSVGIILDVIPHINPDGIVTLQVAPQISQLTSQTVNVGPGVNVPVIDSRQATSQVAIADGQTIVIGGLMQDQKTLKVDKVPLLGDIPIIGAAFSRTQADKTKTELLLFLTPHVASDPSLLKAMSADEMSGTRLTPQAVAPGSFDDQMRGMRLGATQPAAPAR
jgi:type II secretion system protein D